MTNTNSRFSASNTHLLDLSSSLWNVELSRQARCIGFVHRICPDSGIVLVGQILTTNNQTLPTALDKYWKEARYSGSTSSVQKTVLPACRHCSRSEFWIRIQNWSRSQYHHQFRHAMTTTPAQTVHIHHNVVE